MASFMIIKSVNPGNTVSTRARCSKLRRFLLIWLVTVIAILPLSDKGSVMITVARSLHQNSNTTLESFRVCIH
jgi:hypothetical protein